MGSRMALDKSYDPDNLPPGPAPLEQRSNPHPSFIQVARPYIFEKTIQDCKAVMGVNPLREEALRLQGVALVDNVRRALHLWVSRMLNRSSAYRKSGSCTAT